MMVEEKVIVVVLVTSSTSSGTSQFHKVSLQKLVEIPGMVVHIRFAFNAFSALSALKLGYTSGRASSL